MSFLLMLLTACAVVISAVTTIAVFDREAGPPDRVFVWYRFVDLVFLVPLCALLWGSAFTIAAYY